MKINVKSNFKLDETLVETQSATLGALLNELSVEYTQQGFDPFFDRERQEIYPDCAVSLNGRPFEALRSGLNAKLKEGDRVEIQLIILAGG